MFSQISRIPDLIQKFWGKRRGLYAGVYDSRITVNKVNVLWTKNVFPETWCISLQCLIHRCFFFEIFFLITLFTLLTLLTILTWTTLLTLFTVHHLEYTYIIVFFYQKWLLQELKMFTLYHSQQSNWLRERSLYWWDSKIDFLTSWISLKKKIYLVWWYSKNPRIRTCFFRVWQNRFLYFGVLTGILA